VITAALARIDTGKPRCVAVLSCAYPYAIVADLEPGAQSFKIAMGHLYCWHEVLFCRLLDACLQGQTAALAALWQTATPWRPPACVSDKP
jgi:hypothetical protein